MKIENVNPADIEKRSMEIIESEGDFSAFSDSERLILKRIIHTTADFDYIKNIRFSENAVESGLNALKNNAVIITDTKMILSLLACISYFQSSMDDFCIKYPLPDFFFPWQRKMAQVIFLQE